MKRSNILIFLFFFITKNIWLQAQPCNTEESDITQRITMDFADDYVQYPYNSLRTEQNTQIFPGLEQGAGRYYENGQWYERKIRMTQDTVRYGSYALHYRLPERQAEVPLSAYHPGEEYKDRLETRLINQDDFTSYLGNTHYSGFSVYIPASVDTAGATLPGRGHWCLLHQWHQSSPESPPMSLQLIEGFKSRMGVHIRHGVDKTNETYGDINRADKPEEKYIDLALNQWIDFTAKWRFDPFTENGTFVLYMYDPAQATEPPVLLYKYEGKLGYTGTLDQSHMTESIGIYRAANPTGSWEIYYDQIRTGTDWNSVLPWKETACWRFEDDAFVMGKYEAENAAMNAAVDNIHTNYSGTGFATDLTDIGKYVEFTIDADNEGLYKVNAKYTAALDSTGSARTMSIYVNGTDVIQAQYPLTNTWSDWEIQTNTLSLLQGTNTIRYQYDTEDSGGVNLDYITLTPLGAICNLDDPCSNVSRLDPEYNCIPVPIVDENNNAVCDFDECLRAAASSHNGNLPENTLDGDFSTRWSGQGDGEFIEYCFNEIKILQGIELAFYKGDERSTYFDVEVSRGDGRWTGVLCNQASGGASLALEAFPFVPIAAKKLRIIGHRNTQNDWNSITEVKWHSGQYIEVDDTEIIETWNLVTDTGASAGSYIITNETFTNTPADSNTLVYDFSVDSSGNYSIWGRCIAPTANDDSFWIKLNDGNWILWSTAISTDWTWSKINDYQNDNSDEFFLETGAHKLYIHYREDGTKLDRLYITNADFPKPMDSNDLSLDYGLYYEAECAATQGNWLSEANSEASENTYLVHTANTGTPADSNALRFEINVTAADNYQISARTIAPDSGSNSFWFKIDNSNWMFWNVEITSNWTWSKMNDYQNGNLSEFFLAAGTHTLYIHQREAGAQLDKIYIANSTSCNPQDTEGKAINCNDNLCVMADIPCNDGDICTINDVYDTNCDCAGTFLDANNDNVCDCIDVQLQVWLEGAYDPNTNQMTNALHTRGLLPGQQPTSALVAPTPTGQPYNTSPWNYTGTEGTGWRDTHYTSNETDWVLVSFRTGTAKNTEVAQTAALLMQDGIIKMIDRCALYAATDSLYIVLEHRNHIGIMTPQPVDIVNGVLTYDFRISDSYRDPTSFGQKQLPNGNWAMFAGDANQMDYPSFDITGTDKTEWFDNNGVFDYYLSPDFNLDGDVNGQDKTLWFDNNGISSRVPK